MNEDDGHSEPQADDTDGTEPETTKATTGMDEETGEVSPSNARTCKLERADKVDAYIVARGEHAKITDRQDQTQSIRTTTTKDRSEAPLQG